MKEEIYNEKELKALEDEIRALGIPYSQDEPDERYFANFRVHLMERIDGKKTRQSIAASVISWFTISPMRSLSFGGGLVAVIVAALLINPVSEPKISQVQPALQAPIVIAPQQPTLQPIPQNIAAAEKVVKVKKTMKNSTLSPNTKTNSSLDAAINASYFSSMDEVLTNDESEDPVNYENLSESELESVVKITEEMN